MSKFTNIAAGLAVVPMIAFAVPALADGGQGQIEQGDIYRVKNATTYGIGNGNFADNITAQCGQTVAFRVMVHNTGPDAITNVKVAATLDSTTGTSHSSQVSINADNSYSTNVTAKAGLTTDSATSISYVSGSTELLDVNGNVLSTLPDGVTTGGLNIGSVGPLTSDTRDVQFEAKLNCAAPVTPVTPATPVTPTAPTTAVTATTTPTALVNTGAGNVAGIFAAVAAAAVVASQVVLRRRQARPN